MGLLSSGVPDTPTERGGRCGGGGGRGGGGNGGSRGSGGGGDGGSRGSGSGVGSGGGEGSNVGGTGGANRGKLYTNQESIAVVRAWDAITSDPVVGTDQPEWSFWRRVMMAYEEFKPDGADKRDPEQLRKKWSRILRATKRFASIYQNNLLHAESGRSETDVKALSMVDARTARRMQQIRSGIRPVRQERLLEAHHSD
ncbi:keratin-3, type I cytoskeletal 51 kDa-like [Salvia splendens]|uniref:keratin-3, type I cytoskeletal 51 kDa-like n=1 Tax=Salvia splendens TaxID=180675 RepID=UPI001C26FAF9|nr:keratin-3, type I cytoskeletal 51 kDa-like [Salvia splendens]